MKEKNLPFVSSDETDDKKGRETVKGTETSVISRRIAGIPLALFEPNKKKLKLVKEIRWPK
jgi:hypothetical protein